jgi:hypothetical protein
VREFADWKEYQEETAGFFRRQGCTAEVEARVQGVRAEHRIDVYVSFLRHGIKCNWVIECKLWNSRVPKEKVLALKSIVEDVGADRGLIISEEGFQPGAYDAARGTNITLVASIDEFERTASTLANEIKLIRSSEIEGPIFSVFNFPGHDQPHTLLKHGDKVLVGNWQTGNVAVVDPETRTIERIIELDKYEAIFHATNQREIRSYQPGSMAIADGKLFLGQVFSEFLLSIDLDTHAVVKRLTLPGGGEGQVTASPDGRHIYFSSNRVEQFFIVDSATYEFEAVSYPGKGRGSMSILTHPHKPLLYIGIQRGGAKNGKSYFGGNSFLAIYDLNARKYVGTVYLAEIINGRSDDSAPICISYDEVRNQIYVGMFQSMKGIYKIDGDTNEIVGNISFAPNSHNRHFTWVDPLAQTFYKDFILSVNRNNYELAILRKDSEAVIDTIFLGEAPNGPRDLVVVKKEAIISYPARNSLIFVDLDKIAL